MAHPDLDELLDALLPFAQQMLSKHGDFFPFGACMRSDGSIGMIAGHIASEHPPSQEIIDRITAGLRAKASAGEIRAGGICYDVKVRSAASTITDAVCVSLDHASGSPVDVLLPYETHQSLAPSYGELRATPGSIRIFDTRS